MHGGVCETPSTGISALTRNALGAQREVKRLQLWVNLGDLFRHMRMPVTSFARYP